MNASTELFLNRYRVVTEVAPRLGGEAFLCEDTETGNRVEVHRLEANEAREAAFPPVKRTIEALGERPSPALARPLELEWGPEGGLILVQEFHEGEALPAAIRDGLVKEPRSVVRGVLHALASANRRNLHHGGLNPARVLLRTDGGISLLDLGVMALNSTPLQTDYVAPGSPTGERADAFAVARLAVSLCPGALDASYGAALAEALEAIVRADGSARTHDAGALLSLLPTRGRRRHSRFAVSEVWDGGIGRGTQDLFRLAQDPEFAGRMPAEISGSGELQLGGIDSLQFLNTANRPAPVLAEPAPMAPTAAPPPPTPAPVVLTEPAPVAPVAADPAAPTAEPVAPVAADPVSLTAEPVAPVAAPPVGPTPAPAAPHVTQTPIYDQQTAIEPPPPPPPPPAMPAAAPTGRPLAGTTPPPSDDDFTPDLPPSLSGQPTLPPAGIKVTVRPASRRYRGSTTISQLPAVRGSVLARVAGERHVTFLIGMRDDSPSMGRERTNQVVLRSFRGQVVDSVASNRLSRRHLEFGVTEQGFTVSDLKSAYGTELDGAKLAPGAPALLASRFKLTCANKATVLSGRTLHRAIELRRDEEAGHRYLLVWPGARVPVGGDDTSGLALPGVEVCGWLSYDAELDRFALEIADEVDAQFGPAQVPSSVPHPLVSGSVLVNGIELRIRALNAPYDFFSIGEKLAV